MEITEIKTEPQVIYNKQNFRFKVKVEGGYDFLINESGSMLQTEADYYLILED